MNKKTGLRKRLFVDYQVQGALIGRVVLYWFVCLITLTLMILCWRIITGPARIFYTHFDDMWFHYEPALIGTLLLLPLIIYDILRLSNRFTGPLVRLRRSLQALARGEEVAPLHFRNGDYWQEFAQQFNAIAEKMQKLKHAASTNQNNDHKDADHEAVLAETHG